MANERYGSDDHDRRVRLGRNPPVHEGDYDREGRGYSQDRLQGRDNHLQEDRSFSPGGGDPYGDYGQGYGADRFDRDRYEREDRGYRSGEFDRGYGRFDRRGRDEAGPLHQNQYGPNRGVEMNPGYGERQGGYGYGSGGGRKGGDTGSYAYRGGLGRWIGAENPMLADQADGHTGPHRGRGPKNYVRSDERIREDVSDRLADHAHLDASDIDVQVKSGEVTLSGTVEDRHAKRRAEDCAEDVSGVRHVQNNLRVKAADPAMNSTGVAASGNHGRMG
ncbi:BON domain-containing protein [Phenylobacterium montanum]|uniref:BON domain-containing protein n=1 Tax=Phenylobacterium montanum TaxID=2823693 RepID=A0A975FX03_9CAUL|nr:BON domain-containing protein [Caulobacter sp. S6]QUD86845.1 BON domain-containing protein [Caulobacter sp. S6]